MERGKAYAQLEKWSRSVGSIRLTPDLTEIDYLPIEYRIRVGEIILVCAVMQNNLSSLFAHIALINPSVFTYLGHDIDTSKMIKAIQRLVKSDDCPTEVDSGIISVLKKCQKVLTKRNDVAHGPLHYIDGMLIRSELVGGDKPHRLARGLSLQYFDQTLAEAKSALWDLRLQLGRLTNGDQQLQD